MKKTKKQKYYCPTHKEELWQINHGFKEDRYICMTFKCGYTVTEEGTEPEL